MPCDTDTRRSAAILAIQHAGIRVRQQSALVQYELAHAREILHRAGGAERIERPPRRLVFELGLVAEREQRFGAAGFAPGVRDGQHLVRREIGAGPAPGPLHEGAIAAGVAAEPRQRDEDLARIGDDAVVTFIAQACRLRHELGKRALAPSGRSHPGGAAAARWSPAPLAMSQRSARAAAG